MLNSVQINHEVRESWEVTRIEGDLATFPDESVPELRPNLTDLAVKSKELSFRLMRALALALNLEQEYFVDRTSQIFTGDCVTKLRSLYYPALEGKVESGWIRCGEHTGENKHFLKDSKF